MNEKMKIAFLNIRVTERKNIGRPSINLGLLKIEF
jgi:hypothetical protein